MIKISIDESQLKLARNLFATAPEKVHIAAANAINRTKGTLQKTVSVQIRKRYIVKAGTVKKTLNFRRATRSNLTGVLSSSGKPIHLSEFRVRQRKRGPVRVQVLKNGSASPVKGLFINANKGPLHRAQAARYPLRVPYGPSVPQMFGNEETMQALVPIAQKTLNERFAHEVNRLFKGYGGKRK